MVAGTRVMAVGMKEMGTFQRQLGDKISRIVDLGLEEEITSEILASLLPGRRSGWREMS